VDAARAAYDQAIAACRNDVEREFLVRRREELDGGS
jgi:RNA polymerase sigma-70 factor (ECF subfamily)